MKGYMTKYALTAGIQEVRIEDKEPPPTDGDYVYTTRTLARAHRIQLRFNKSFFLDKETAEAEAKMMATKKLRSLQTQMAKMQLLAKWPKWDRRGEGK
jgi:hypothetical protein